MTSLSAQTRYTRTAVVLHWSLAATIVLMMFLGYYMIGVPQNTFARKFLLNAHKFIGLLALILGIAAIAWRATHSPPPLPSELRLSKWQRSGVRLAHCALYAFILAQPLTGYLTSAFGKYGITLMGLSLADPAWEDARARSVFDAAHQAAAIAFIALIVLHISATLKHSLVDRDGLLRRMLP